MKTPKKIRGQLRQECGFTLIEMLVGLAVTLVIFMLALAVIDGTGRTEGRIETAALSVGDARVFTERVGRDLRLTHQVDSATPNSLTVDTYVRHADCGDSTPSTTASLCQVTYSCSAGSCTRQEFNPDGSCPSSCPPVTLVTGLSDDNVFSYLPDAANPDFVGLNVVLPNQSNIGGDAISLQDGTALRNIPPQ